MDENKGSAGPALASHSKDASATGQTPASAAVAEPTRPESSQHPETIVRILDQVKDVVRQQPIASIVVSVVLGVLITKFRGQR